MAKGKIRNYGIIALAAYGLAALVGCASPIKYRETKHYPGGLVLNEIRRIQELPQLERGNEFYVSGITCPKEFEALRDLVLSMYEDKNSREIARKGTVQIELSQESSNKNRYWARLYGSGKVAADETRKKITETHFGGRLGSLPGYSYYRLATHFPVDKDSIPPNVLEGKCK